MRFAIDDPDDPRLSVRLEDSEGASPLRCVLDPELRTPAEARLFAEPEGDEEAGEDVIFCRDAAAQSEKAEQLRSLGAARLTSSRPSLAAKAASE